MQAGQAEKEATLLVVTAINADASGKLTPVTTGVYPVVSIVYDGANPGRRAEAGFIRTDSACRRVMSAGQTSGGVFTLDRSEAKEGGVATGTFEIPFDADRLKGSFEARYCATTRLTGSTCP